MTTYAVGHLREVRMGPAIADYLARIDASLLPFGGRFIIHGGKPEMLEGDFPGDLVVIAFADRERALAWYRSAAYQAILPLRTENSASHVFVIDGVDENHKATDVLD